MASLDAVTPPFVILPTGDNATVFEKTVAPSYNGALQTIISVLPAGCVMTAVALTATRVPEEEPVASEENFAVELSASPQNWFVVAFIPTSNVAR